jgi:tetratricopeptide (TPR) repeat protein
VHHDADIHYYAMQFIQGRGLDVVFAELRAAATGSTTITLSATAALLSGRFPGAERAGESEAAAGPGIEAGGGPDLEAISAGAASPPSGSTAGANEAAAGPAARTTYYRSVARVGADVADALAYAHSQGILHRDIKPSNLLLDAGGSVWVTDFGLAKAEGADALTETGDLVGTLRYLAPERLEGWSDPRSDVYSLGATLYELLTLRPLFDESDRARLIRRVAHESPAAPRHLDPGIPRDLETIVLKAIAKEPAQRYAAAAPLAEDLRRFLADRPILARRTGRAERLWRWSRRNPALAGALGSLFLILTLGCAGMTVLWRRAESQRRRADGLLVLSEQRRTLAEGNRAEAERQRGRAEAHFGKARAAVDELLTRVAESQLANVPGLQPLRQDLLRSALAFYEDFVRQRAGDPTLKAGLASAQLRLARIQHDLGAESQSQRTTQQALAFHEAALRDQPDDRGLRDGLAQCCVFLGAGALDPLHPSRPADEALRLFERAIALWEPLRQAEPENTLYLGDLANTYNLIAILHTQNQRMAEALRAHQRALVLRQKLVEARPDDPRSQYDLGTTLNNLGVLLDRTGNESLEKLQIFRRAARHNRIAHDKAPQVVRYGRLLTVALRNVAVYEHQLGHEEAALRAVRESLAVSKRLARENPAIPSLRQELIQDYSNVGNLLREQGHPVDAVRTYRESRERAETLPRETADDWFHLAGLLALCARPAVDPGAPVSDAERAECQRHADAAIAALEQAVAAGFKNAELIGASDELSALRDRDDFRAVLARAEAAAAGRGPAKAPVRTTAAPAGKPAGREVTPRAAGRESGHDPAGGADPWRRELASSQHAIGLIQLELGALEEAKATLGEALTARAALVRDHPRDPRYRADLAATRVALARRDWRAGRLDVAVRSWDEARRDLESRREGHPNESVIADELAELEATVGHSHAEQALWEEAAAAMARAIRRGSRDWLVGGYRASLLALTGDRDGLRALCSEILDTYGRTTDATFASVLARWCALGPGSAPDPARLVRLAEKAVAAGHREPRPLFHLGLAEYRAGRFEEATRHAREAPAALPDGDRDRDSLGALATAVLAMAEHRLGRVDEAARRLEAISRIDWRTIERWPEPQAWWDRADFLVLKREAIELGTGRPAPEDPELRRRRGRAYAQLGRTAKAESEFRAAEAASPKSSGPAGSAPSAGPAR